MLQQFRRQQYIWEQMDWPRFRWDDAAIIGPLAELSAHYGALAGRMSLIDDKDCDEVQIRVLADELDASAKIEGVTLNKASVRSSLAKRLGLEQYIETSPDHYIEGLVEVSLDVAHNSAAPLTAARLFGWHAALFPTGYSGMLNITVGAWRVGAEPMQVVSGPMGRQKVHFEAPPSEAVGAEMQNFLDWFNTCRLSPFVKSALTHLWLVTIHPFDDGNGRLARTVADMALAHDVMDGARYISVSAEINRRKKSYYEILERTLKGALDVTEWVLWYLECIGHAVDSATRAVEAVIAKSLYWHRFADVSVNARQRKVVNRLWDGFEGNLTSTKYAKICHCSQDTAMRDINQLLERGMLKKGAGGGRSTHYLLAREITDGA